jgi:hypothetical protein
MDVLSVVVTVTLSPLSVFRTNSLEEAVTPLTVPVICARGAVVPCATNTWTGHATQSKENAQKIVRIRQPFYPNDTLTQKCTGHSFAG